MDAESAATASNAPCCHLQQSVDCQFLTDSCWGYHSSSMQMSLVYSRDGAAASLLLLERLIDEIVKGKFRPDSTRSGRIVESPDELPGAHLSHVKVEVVNSSDDDAASNQDVEESSDRHFRLKLF